MSKTINKPIVFLPIENTHRELDYKLNLARLFCEKGYDVVIGNPPFIRDELKYRNYKGAFLEKGVNPDPEYYTLLKEKGVLLYCLSDEGAAYPAFSVNYQPAVDALKLMNHIFLWGHFQMQDLIKRNPDKELNKKYMVSGPPGIEFSLPMYKGYHQKLKPKILQQEYILVNTNFGSFNGFSIDEIIKTCTLMSPDTRKMIEKSYKKEEILFKEFCIILKEILNNFPQEIFLIRPHPTEKIENYVNFFSDFKNIIISKDGNINNAISSAKLVIHNDCTSALQSYLMGVSVISLAHNHIEGIHARWALSFGALPRSPKEAISYIKYILQHKKMPPEIEKHVNEQAHFTINEMFSNLGKSAIDIVSVMISELQENFKGFKPYKLKNSRSILNKLKFFARRCLPLHYKVPVASRGLLLKFSKKDLQQRLNFLQEIDGLPNTFNIKKLFPNAYLISKEK